MIKEIKKSGLIDKVIYRANVRDHKKLRRSKKL